MLPFAKPNTQQSTAIVSEAESIASSDNEEPPAVEAEDHRILASERVQFAIDFQLLSKYGIYQVRPRTNAISQRMSVRSVAPRRWLQMTGTA